MGYLFTRTVIDVEYTWILTQGKTCCQFRLLFSLSFIGQFVNPVDAGVKGVDGGIVILTRCEFHFLREHENLV